MFEELIREIIKIIEASETKSRSRNETAQINFEHAVKVILLGLWKSVKSIPAGEVSINKRSGYYSENPRYRDTLMTYKQTMAAFDGLERLRFIEVTQKEYLDRTTFQGKVTRIVARDELLERLNELEGHPAIFVKPEIDAETIILRDKIGGKKLLKKYEDTHRTERYRNNLKQINSCFLRHWFDLEVKDEEVDKLASRISNHETKEPIDFSKRTLVRIFANGSFEEGGRS